MTAVDTDAVSVRTVVPPAIDSSPEQPPDESSERVPLLARPMASYYLIASAAALLLVLGLVMVLSASSVVAYSAAKAALLNLTLFLAREWAPYNVRVNSITPGFFPGEQNRRLLFHEDGTPTPRGQVILGHTPMARFGIPSELAGAAVFLASEKASGFVTGIDVRVDGGFLSQTI